MTDLKPSTPPSTWHTGDKNSHTLVRYFPVTRKKGDGKWRSNWGEHDIRFRGQNGRLLRLFYNKKTLEISRMEPDNWSKKQIDAFNYIYPNGRDSLPVSTKQKRIRSIVENEPLEWLTKKGAKQLVRRADTRHRDALSVQAALIAKLVQAPNRSDKFHEAVAKIAKAAAEAEKAAEEKKEEEPVETIDTLLAEQKNINLHICYLKNKVDEWQEKQRKVTDKIKKKQKEQKKEKRKEERRKKINELAAELERLKRLNEEDEDSSDEDSSDDDSSDYDSSDEEDNSGHTIRIDSSDEEIDDELEEEEELEEIEGEEPDFPGEEEVEGWSHKSLEQWEDVDFYIDEENNVWDENMAFVGIYQGWSDTISFKEDYEPEE